MSSVLLTKNFSGDNMEKKEMGGACSAYKVEETCIQGLGGGNLRVRNHLVEPGVDGKIIFRWIFRKWDVGLWTGLS